MSMRAMSIIVRFQLVSVADQAGSSLVWSLTPKTVFLVTLVIRDKCGRISERTLPKIPISQTVPRRLNVSAQLNSPRLISYPSTLQLTLTTCLF